MTRRDRRVIGSASGLNRRERQDLESLARLLRAQDPELADALTWPPPPAREVWAARLGSVMLVAGVVLLAAGVVFDVAGVGAVGAALLLSCWLPPRIVAVEQ